MSWQGQISTIVRNIISDTNPANYKYTQNRLETAILVAAHLVVTEVEFNQTYSIDIEERELLPDPTNPNTKDDYFVTLISLKCACIVLGSEVRAESGNAISIKDGPSAIDLRGVSSTLMVLYKDLCEKYDKALYDYKEYGIITAGQAILGPYAPGSDYITRNYNDSDHRGGYFNY